MVDDGDRRISPKSAKPRLVLFLLFCIYMVNAMDRGIISVVAEPIRRDLMLDDTHIGLITGLVFGIFYAVFSVPMAWMAEAFGRVRTIALACVAWSLCSAASGIAANFVQLAATRMGLAIGEAGGTAPSHSLLAEYYPPERRATALSILSLGGPVGAFLGIALCGWIAQHHGWRAALIVVSLPGVLFAAALFALVREPEKADRVDSAKPNLLEDAKSFCRSPLLRAVSLAAGLNCITTYGLTAWLPAWLMRAQGMALDQVGIYYGVTLTVAVGLGFYLGGWFGDRLAARIGRKAYAIVPCLSMLIGAPFLLAAVMVKGWPLSLALLFPPMFLMSTYLGPYLALVQNQAGPGQRSIFAALFLLVTNLVGNGGGPLLVGMISDAMKPLYGDGGLTIALGMLAPMMLLASVTHCLTVKTLIRSAA